MLDIVRLECVSLKFLQPNVASSNIELLESLKNEVKLTEDFGGSENTSIKFSMLGKSFEIAEKIDHRFF